MEIEIDGKIYELVETPYKTQSPCHICAFDIPPHGCKIGTNECCNLGNENKYWKLK